MKGSRPVEHIGGQPKQDIRVDVQIQINHTTKKVSTQFNMAVTHINSDPPEAVAIARALLQGANMLDPKSTEGFTWPTMTQ